MFPHLSQNSFSSETTQYTITKLSVQSRDTNQYHEIKTFTTLCVHFDSLEHSQ